MPSIDLEREEVLEVLTLVNKLNGYNFLNYSEASIKRRMLRFMGLSSIQNAFELKNLLVNDPKVYAQFIDEIPVLHTEMFRDAACYQALKNDVYPYLATYPHPKIWHAACATGQEVYSNAIFLHEAGLLERSRIYATDISKAGLHTSQTGNYKLQQLAEYEKNYQEAKGSQRLSDYYSTEGKQGIMKPYLTKKVIFSFHNLVTDGSFNEFNLIMCRNVLIYFNLELQNRVFKLLYDSLAPFGYLVLGTKESMYGSGLQNHFELINEEARVYRKKN